MLNRTTKPRRAGAGGRTRASALPCLVLLAAAGCGVLGRERPGVQVNPAEQARIRREVEARLAAEPSIEAARVRVAVDGATVSLYGAIRGFGALQCAIANAELVPGVQNVADFLVLERGPLEVRCLAPRSVRAALPDTIPGAAS